MGFEARDIEEQHDSIPSQGAVQDRQGAQEVIKVTAAGPESSQLALEQQAQQAKRMEMQ